LAAALDGIRKEMPLQPPAEGWSYADEEVATVPTSLHAALDALEADTDLLAILGGQMISTFVTLKRDEVARYERWVSDWDIEEYFHHL
jgi:glutamine synthetase